jgi:hypothetical protein
MMSKKITKTLALLSLLCLIPASFLTGFAQRAGVAPGNARNAAIVAMTDAVLKETAELRELSILKEVQSGAQSRADIERMIIKNLKEDSSPAEMHATELILKSFGLAPANFRYRPFLIKLLTEQVAGYYDPKAKRFYLADWIELDGQKPVMAHELVHALQDQHFNLKRFENWPKGDSDAELAAHALIEGDATLAMTLYMTKNPLVALAFMRSLGSQGSSSAQFKSAPRALQESLLFPYEEGSQWATQVYKRGGWELVSRAFSKLPQSSEQILHAEKYFAYESPVKLTLPAFKKQLGVNWKRIDSDVNGEWGYYLILEEFLNDAAESKRASAGWGGDRFTLYEDPKTGRVFVAQITIWDTTIDAREFYDAYARRTLKRYPTATSNNASTAEVDRQVWRTTAGKALLQIKGDKVLILEGVPAKLDPNALAKMVWQTQSRVP